MRDGLSDKAYSIATSPVSGSVFVVGQENSNSALNRAWIIRKSTTGASGSFSTVDAMTGTIYALTYSDTTCFGVAVDNNDIVYACGYEQMPAGFSQAIIKRSTSHGSSGTFTFVDRHLDATNVFNVNYSVFCDSNNNVYVGGYQGTNGRSCNFTMVCS